MTEQLRGDGFAGQRLHVLPEPLVAEALRRPVTAKLLATDAGYFPCAAGHGRHRPSGVWAAILILCQGGAGWCELDGVRHDVRAGQLLVIPPGRPHRYQADPRDPWSIWWLHLVGSDLADLLAASGLSSTRPVAQVVDPTEAAALIDQACRSLGRDETTASLVEAAGAAWHLLALLAAQRDRRAPGDVVIAKVLSGLRAEMAGPTNVSALARAAGLSVSHFQARFRAVTGFPVGEYCKRLRMAKARELLLTTDAGIADIARQVGYGDPLYFSRQFRGVSGVSPRDFRGRASFAT